MKKNRLFLSMLIAFCLSVTSVLGQTVYDSLFLVGDATPSGWNIGSPVSMIRNANDTTIFTWQGLLTAGSIKISTFTGNWCDGDWLNAGVASQSVDSATYIITHGCDGPDNQWAVSSSNAGLYLLKVNFTNETISFSQISQSTFDHLYLVGDATEVGWNISEPLEMTQDGENPYIFSWQGVLKTGQFKISTFTGDWCDGDWLNASEPDQPFTEAEYIITHGCDGPDNKWTIVDSMVYTITVNLYDTLITVIPYVEPSYEMLYIVGDATPSGWNISSPEAMVKDENNSKLFTWEGALTAGEVKFSTYTGDWCDGDWIVATQANQSITANDYTIRHGCEGEDNKWKLLAEEAGNYKITIDLENETIQYEKQDGVTGQTSNKISCYPNPASDMLYIDLGEDTKASVCICNNMGQVVYQAVQSSRNSVIDLNKTGVSGLIFIRISTLNQTNVIKVVVSN